MSDVTIAGPAVHLVEHADGIYLGQRDTDYLADWALGSGALKDLLAEPAEWWWSSPFNTIDPQPKKLNKLGEEVDAAHFRLGTALHVAFLEGMDTFNRIYGVAPTKQDYPEALDTLDDLKQACRERFLKVSGDKADLIDRLVVAEAPVQILSLIVREWSRLGLTSLTQREMAKILLLYRQAMMNPHGIRTVGEEEVRLSDAFAGGLSEVSVFWTDVNGIRQRARFDKIHPNSITDLKSFANWTKSNFRRALLDETVRRGYVLQAAHYDEARHQLRRLFKEGKVFGGTPAQLELLAEIAASEAWAWIWAFVKTAGAPLVKGVRLNMNGLRFAEAQSQREAALANFIAYRTYWGLEPGKMWFDPADSIWEPEEEDWTFGVTLNGQ